MLVTLADPGTRDRCRAEMVRMDGAIPGLVDLTVTLNELGGDHAADLALTTRWVDVDAYHAYENHPLHLEVREVVLGLMASASTIDYSLPDPVVPEGPARG